MDNGQRTMVDNGQWSIVYGRRRRGGARGEIRCHGFEVPSAENEVSNTMAKALASHQGHWIPNFPQDQSLSEDCNSGRWDYSKLGCNAQLI